MSYQFHAVKTAAHDATLTFYGLTKEAVNLRPLKDGVKRLFTWKDPVSQGGYLGTAKTVGRYAREFGRDMVFGSPLSALKTFKDLRQTTGGSTLKAIPKYVKNFYWQRPTNLSSGLFQAVALAMPAMDLYHAARTEDPNIRRGDLASAAAGILAAPVTAHLGLAGGMAQPWLQQKARELVQRDPTPYTPAYDPVQHTKLVLKGVRSYGPASALAATDLEF